MRSAMFIAFLVGAFFGCAALALSLTLGVPGYFAFAVVGVCCLFVFAVAAAVR